MKRISTLVLILLFSIKALAQHDKTESLQQSSLKKASQEATIIFEGKVVKQNKSFWGTGDNSNSIYTSYTLEVKEVLFGDIKSGTIEIIVAGGQAERDGMIIDSRSEHGNGLCNQSGLFFAKPSNKGNTGIVNSNFGDYDLVVSFCFNPDGALENNPYDDTYKTKEQLYDGLSQFKAIKKPSSNGTQNIKESAVPEKKNSNAEEKVIEGSLNFNYEQNVKNYERNYALLLEKINTSKSKFNKSSANDITFGLANTSVTGTSPRYFEFDIM